MNDIKLLALDLDGTLFNKEKIVSDANKEAIFVAKELGIKVVITTGRPLLAIGNLLDELGLLDDDDYCITFNGGLVQRNTGEILDKSSLSLEEVSYLHQQLQLLQLPTDILSDGKVYSIPSPDGRRSEYYLASPLLDFVEIADFDQLPKGIVYNKIVTVTDADFLDEALAGAKEDAFENFEAFKSRDIIFEVMPKGVHKAFGLQLLCKHLGFSAENVMAMGDEANDFTMLEWAGLGVAMANAVADAKQIADKVTRLTNDQSGVAEAIQKYILNEEI
ncbi:Cof-type HAD-IIB family hydrolase [Streptococcus iniae]|uniref:Cof-type HAD-IIB family hydrolase n=1 Tax=Streptococcus iniae TaxID=1346 RepID=UPI002B295576|nr:Cof-type HAD-IIB family hydrolase [Streptococcus iniae]WNZ89403.1 Cof-type HAD-IIB family hydrolase [Streptococcus iniae]WNZ91039.1 Cof-type HAD-IIB family hydrolase [Streptococcus iniae]WNZ92554.1 Cof-type HAD-IIB family hydrolase [Streptococcus iniae]WNZ95181.1 Cof-type HAD-IIB family hydrolase [Streptococcus iniae]